MSAEALGEDYKTVAARGGASCSRYGMCWARGQSELGRSCGARCATLAHGSTTIEVKSGYGSTRQRAQAAPRHFAGKRRPSNGPRWYRLSSARTTSAGVPDRRADYVRPRERGDDSRGARERLAAAVDVFCEPGVANLAGDAHDSKPPRGNTGWR